MRKPLIAGNWKMNKTASEAVNLVRTIKAGVHTLEKEVDIVLCPPFTAVATVSEEVKGSSLQVGAQNMHNEAGGAFTGEIAPDMLKDLGCRYVILGHSERRSYFNESDEFVNKKLKTALKYNLVPIVCVGECLEDREASKHFDVVKSQFEGTFADVSAEDMEKTVIAYEPVWAIGTGKTASPEQAQEMHQFIRKLIQEKIGDVVAKKIRILYGGSMKPDNVVDLISQEDVDGGLIGGAALKAESFVEIIQGSIKEGVK